MLAILQFIFSSFWRWLGATIMLMIIFEGIGSMFKGIIINKIKKGRDKGQIRSADSSVRGKAD